jgi:hypothetical protein
MPMPHEAGAHLFLQDENCPDHLESLWLGTGGIEDFDTLQQVTQVLSLTGFVLEGHCAGLSAKSDMGGRVPRCLTWLTTMRDLRKFVLHGDGENRYVASQHTLDTLGQMAGMADLGFYLAHLVTWVC